MPRRWILHLLLLFCLAPAAVAGIAVKSVQEGGPAAAAGLEPGDILLEVAGQAAGEAQDLHRILSGLKPGKPVPVTVRRGDGRLVLTLTPGTGAGGRALLGISFKIHGGHGAGQGDVAVGGEHGGTETCLGWVESTYQVTELLDQLGMDLGETYATARSCIVRDTQRMSEENAVKYCDNVFKVHCSGLDLLTEIGETLAVRCQETLRRELGLGPGQRREWLSCGGNAVFDDYSRGKGVTRGGHCRAVAEAACGPGGGQPQPEPAAAPPAAPLPGRTGPGDLPAAWTQWGGPRQDFSAPASGLAASWPEDGPARLWSRELGEGYSAILYEDGRLYTMYRRAGQEVVACLDARTGATLWEHAYDAMPDERHQHGFGDGPRSTPALAGERIFTVGVAGRLHALSKKDGKVLWSHDLWAEPLAGNVLEHGYSSSLALYRDMVILPVGGPEAGLVAFHQATGRVRWKTPGMQNSYSSPRVLTLAGEEHMVAFMAEEVLGLDPATGTVRWRFPHANQWRTNVHMPAVAGGDTLLISSPQAGARGLRVAREGPSFRVEEVWSTRRVQFYHVTSAQQGDWVYGSSGTTTPAFLTAINIRTGQIGWRERGFAKANCMDADGRILILDEDGVLALAAATPERLDVQARARITDRRAWTVPTLVGRVLYVRDSSKIMALDLGEPSAPREPT